jgi:DNA-binding transcriptional LysR family regulator
MHNIEAVPIFVRVAEQESFSAAAREVGLSKSQVSKIVRELEDRLGVRLLNRTTRRVSLTSEGQEYFAQCRRILGELQDAEHALSRHQTSPAGLLRVSMPVSLGMRYLAPIVAEFLALHPGIEMDVELSDRRVDLVEEGFDVAIRVGELTESSLVARRLAPTRLFMCASPSYLAARGTPEHPRELEQHACMVYGLQQLQARQWKLERNGEVVLARVGGPIVANNGELLMEAAVAGMGITLAPDFILQSAVEQGKLVRIMVPWSGWSAAVWAVYPHRRHLSPKVRAFVEHISQRLAPHPPWWPEGEAGGP